MGGPVMHAVTMSPAGFVLAAGALRSTSPGSQMRARMLNRGCLV